MDWSVNQLFAQNLTIELAPPHIFFMQIGGISVCIYLLLQAFRRSPGVWRRFGFFFSWVFIFFYLLPAVIYGGHLYIGFPSWLFFFLSTNIISIGLAIWVFASSVGVTTGRSISLSNADFLGRGQKALLGALLFLVLGGFFYFVPWSCTGLWALIFDSKYVLLAREISMKLNGVPWASRLYGFYVSVLGPLLCFIGIYGAAYYWRVRQYFKVFLSATILCAAIFLLLLGGVKGVLLGAGVFVAYAILSLPTSLSRRVLASMICLAVFAGMVFIFGLIRDKNQNKDHDIQYDLVGCTQHFGARENVLRLLRTAAVRKEGGLGLTVEQLEGLSQKIDGKDQPHDNNGKSALLEDFGSISLSDASNHDVAERWIKPLWNRLFVVPIQVASWHFFYVEEVNSSGWLVIPIVNRLVGDGSNLAELVYSKYGVLYSSGDVTSTSTAPTTFIYSYSAHLGWVGIALSLGLLIALDMLSAILLRAGNPVLLAAISGFFAALGISLASSDFFTVMFSHGGLFGLCMFWLLKKLDRNISTGK